MWKKSKWRRWWILMEKEEVEDEEGGRGVGGEGWGTGKMVEEQVDEMKEEEEKECPYTASQQGAIKQLSHHSLVLATFYPTWRF